MKGISQVVTSFKELCQRNIFTLLTAGVGVWALLRVPQIRNLWLQTPPIGVGRLRFEYIAYILALCWFYAPAVPTILPVLPSEEGPGFSGLALRLLFGPAEISASWLGFVAGKLRRLGRAVLGMVLLLLAVAIFVKGAGVPGSRLYPLAGALCQLSGFLFLLIGGLLFVWSAWPQTFTLRRNNAWTVTGRAFSWLLVATMLGEAIWILASHSLFDFSYRTYSVWALFHFVIVLIGLGSLIDFWHCRTSVPARQLALCGILLVLWSEGPQTVRDASPEKPVTAVADSTSEQQTATPAQTDWYEYASARLGSMPPGPVVIVAPSGGGSRAAIFTMLCLKLLARTPMQIPSADYELRLTAKTSTDTQAGSPTWADNVFLISSVSGGSLATAAFVHKSKEPVEEREDLLHTSREELISRTLDHLQAAEGLDPQTNGGQESAKETRKLLWAQGLIADDAWRNSNKVSWVFRDALVDEMCIDFMAPILRGIATPGASHGDTLAHFWDQRFGWSQANRLTWGQRLAPGALPLMVLNACDIDQGSRLAIGIPPLPADLFGSESQIPGTTSDPGRRPRELAEYDPSGKCDLSLARAVRLSSNFPWGFPISLLGSTSRPPLNVNDPIRVLDGGVIDNTGIDTVYHLVRTLSWKAATPSATNHAEAAEILDQLRRRGVVVIEIDSGAKPMGQTEAGPLASIEGPVGALNNALYSNADLTKSFYRREIEAQLAVPLNVKLPAAVKDDRDPRGVDTVENLTVPSVFWQTFRCNHIQSKKAEVMTAWALGPDDKAIVFGQFLANMKDWDEFTAGLPGQFQNVRDLLQGDRARVKRFALERITTHLLDSTRQVIDRLQRAPKNSPEFRKAAEQGVTTLRQEQQLVREAEVLARDLGPEDRSTLDQVRKQFDLSLRGIADVKGVDVSRLSGVVAQGQKSIDDLWGNANAKPLLAVKSEADRESIRKFQSDVDQRVVESKQYYERQSK